MARRRGPARWSRTVAVGAAAAVAATTAVGTGAAGAATPQSRSPALQRAVDVDAVLRTA